MSTDTEARAFLDGATPPNGAPMPVLRSYRRYSDDIAAEICEAIANGKSLKQICSQDGMPSVVTIYKWMHVHPEFRQAYDYALEAYCDEECNEMKRIADGTESDFITVADASGAESVTVNKEAIARSELRIKTRQWIIERRQPRRRYVGGFHRPEYPPRNPEDAKLIGSEQTRPQDHPMYAAQEAWRRAMIEQQK
jgi:hypothetical protein